MSNEVMSIWKINNINFQVDFNSNDNNIDFKVERPPGGWQLNPQVCKHHQKQQDTKASRSPTPDTPTLNPTLSGSLLRSLCKEIWWRNGRGVGLLNLEVHFLIRAVGGLIIRISSLPLNQTPWSYFNQTPIFMKKLDIVGT